MNEKQRIPKIKKKQIKDNLQLVDVNNRDVQNLLREINKTCLDTEFRSQWEIEGISMVHNSELEEKYIKRRTELKDEGRMASSLLDQFGFLVMKSPVQTTSVASKGLQATRKNYNRLGKGECGVYINRYFDIELKSAWNLGDSSTQIFVFKYFHGRRKGIALTNLSVGDSCLEPTPNYDCHTSSVHPKKEDTVYRQTALSSVYLYEYTDACEPSEYPRQCLPYAVIKCKKRPLVPKPVSNHQVLSKKENQPSSTKMAPGQALITPPVKNADKVPMTVVTTQKGSPVINTGNNNSNNVSLTPSPIQSNSDINQNVLIDHKVPTLPSNHSMHLNKPSVSGAGLLCENKRPRIIDKRSAGSTDDLIKQTPHYTERLSVAYAKLQDEQNARNFNMINSIVPNLLSNPGSHGEGHLQQSSVINSKCFQSFNSDARDPRLKKISSYNKPNMNVYSIPSENKVSSQAANIKSKNSTSETKKLSLSEYVKQRSMEKNNEEGEKSSTKIASQNPNVPSCVQNSDSSPDCYTADVNILPLRVKKSKCSKTANGRSPVMNNLTDEYLSRFQSPQAKLERKNDFYSQYQSPVPPQQNLFQSLTSNPVRADDSIDKPVQILSTSPKPRLSPRVEKPKFLPLPVESEDGSIKYVYRGVDGTMKEIAPSSAKSMDGKCEEKDISKRCVEESEPPTQNVKEGANKLFKAFQNVFTDDKKMKLIERQLSNGKKEDTDKDQQQSKLEAVSNKVLDDVSKNNDENREVVGKDNLVINDKQKDSAQIMDNGKDDTTNIVQHATKCDSEISESSKGKCVSKDKANLSENTRKDSKNATSKNRTRNESHVGKSEKKKPPECNKIDSKDNRKITGTVCGKDVIEKDKKHLTKESTARNKNHIISKSEKKKQHCEPNKIDTDQNHKKTIAGTGKDVIDKGGKSRTKTASDLNSKSSKSGKGNFKSDGKHAADKKPTDSLNHVREKADDHRKRLVEREGKHKVKERSDNSDVKSKERPSVHSKAKNTKHLKIDIINKEVTHKNSKEACSEISSGSKIDNQLADVSEKSVYSSTIEFSDSHIGMHSGEVNSCGVEMLESRDLGSESDSDMSTEDIRHSPLFTHDREYPKFVCRSPNADIPAINFSLDLSAQTASSKSYCPPLRLIPSLCSDDATNSVLSEKNDTPVTSSETLVKNQESSKLTKSQSVSAIAKTQFTSIPDENLVVKPWSEEKPNFITAAVNKILQMDFKVVEKPEIVGSPAKKSQLVRTHMDQFQSIEKSVEKQQVVKTKVDNVASSENCLHRMPNGFRTKQDEKNQSHTVKDKGTSSVTPIQLPLIDPLIPAHNLKNLENVESKNLTKKYKPATHSHSDLASSIRCTTSKDSLIVIKKATTEENVVISESSSSSFSYASSSSSSSFVLSGNNESCSTITEPSVGKRSTEQKEMSSNSFQVTSSDSESGTGDDEEEKCVPVMTRSLSMEELGFGCYLQALSDMRYQPSTLLVDFKEAIDKGFHLSKCGVCEKELTSDIMTGYISGLNKDESYSDINEDGMLHDDNVVVNSGSYQIENSSYERIDASGRSNPALIKSGTSDKAVLMEIDECKSEHNNKKETLPHRSSSKTVIEEPESLITDHMKKKEISLGMQKSIPSPKKDTMECHINFKVMLMKRHHQRNKLNEIKEKLKNKGIIDVAKRKLLNGGRKSSSTSIENEDDLRDSLLDDMLTCSTDKASTSKSTVKVANENKSHLEIKDKHHDLHKEKEIVYGKKSTQLESVKGGATEKEDHLDLFDMLEKDKCGVSVDNVKIVRKSVTKTVNLNMVPRSAQKFLKKKEITVPKKGIVLESSESITSDMTNKCRESHSCESKVEEKYISDTNDYNAALKDVKNGRNKDDCHTTRNQPNGTKWKPVSGFEDIFDLDNPALPSSDNHVKSVHFSLTPKSKSESNMTNPSLVDTSSCISKDQECEINDSQCGKERNNVKGADLRNNQYKSEPQHCPLVSTKDLYSQEILNTSENEAVFHKSVAETSVEEVVMREDEDSLKQNLNENGAFVENKDETGTKGSKEDEKHKVNDSIMPAAIEKQGLDSQNLNFYLDQPLGDVDYRVGFHFNRQNTAVNPSLFKNFGGGVMSENVHGDVDYRTHFTHSSPNVYSQYNYNPLNIAAQGSTNNNSQHFEAQSELSRNQYNMNEIDCERKLLVWPSIQQAGTDYRAHNFSDLEKNVGDHNEANDSFSTCDYQSDDPDKLMIVNDEPSMSGTGSKDALRAYDQSEVKFDSQQSHLFTEQKNLSSSTSQSDYWIKPKTDCRTRLDDKEDISTDKGLVNDSKLELTANIPDKNCHKSHVDGDKHFENTQECEDADSNNAVKNIEMCLPEIFGSLKSKKSKSSQREIPFTYSEDEESDNENTPVKDDKTEAVDQGITLTANQELRKNLLETKGINLTQDHLSMLKNAVDAFSHCLPSMVPTSNEKEKIETEKINLTQDHLFRLKQAVTTVSKLIPTAEPNKSKEPNNEVLGMEKFNQDHLSKVTENEELNEDVLGTGKLNLTEDAFSLLKKAVTKLRPSDKETEPNSSKEKSTEITDETPSTKSQPPFHDSLVKLENDSSSISKESHKVTAKDLKPSSNIISHCPGVVKDVISGDTSSVDQLETQLLVNNVNYDIKNRPCPSDIKKEILADKKTSGSKKREFSEKSFLDRSKKYDVKTPKFEKGSPDTKNYELESCVPDVKKPELERTSHEILSPVGTAPEQKFLLSDVPLEALTQAKLHVLEQLKSLNEDDDDVDDDEDDYTVTGKKDLIVLSDKEEEIFSEEDDGHESGEVLSASEEEEISSSSIKEENQKSESKRQSTCGRSQSISSYANFIQTKLDVVDISSESEVELSEEYQLAKKRKNIQDDKRKVVHDTGTPLIISSCSSLIQSPRSRREKNDYIEISSQSDSSPASSPIVRRLNSSSSNSSFVSRSIISSESDSSLVSNPRRRKSHSITKDNIEAAYPKVKFPELKICLDNSSSNVEMNVKSESNRRVIRVKPSPKDIDCKTESKDSETEDPVQKQIVDTLTEFLIEARSISSEYQYQHQDRRKHFVKENSEDKCHTSSSETWNIKNEESRFVQENSKERLYPEESSKFLKEVSMRITKKISSHVFTDDVMSKRLIKDRLEDRSQARYDVYEDHRRKRVIKDRSWDRSPVRDEYKDDRMGKRIIKDRSWDRSPVRDVYKDDRMGKRIIKDRSWDRSPVGDLPSDGLMRKRLIKDRSWDRSPDREVCIDDMRKRITKDVTPDRSPIRHVYRDGLMVKRPDRSPDRSPVRRKLSPVVSTNDTVGRQSIRDRSREWSPTMSMYERKSERYRMKNNTCDRYQSISPEKYCDEDWSGNRLMERNSKERSRNMSPERCLIDNRLEKGKPSIKYVCSDDRHRSISPGVEKKRNLEEKDDLYPRSQNMSSPDISSSDKREESQKHISKSFVINNKGSESSLVEPMSSPSKKRRVLSPEGRKVVSSQQDSLDHGEKNTDKYEQVNEKNSNKLSVKDCKQTGSSSTSISRNDISSSIPYSGSGSTSSTSYSGNGSLSNFSDSSPDIAKSPQQKCSQSRKISNQNHQGSNSSPLAISVLKKSCKSDLVDYFSFSSDGSSPGDKNKNANSSSQQTAKEKSPSQSTKYDRNDNKFSQQSGNDTSSQQNRTATEKSFSPPTRYKKRHRSPIRSYRPRQHPLDEFMKPVPKRKVQHGDDELDYYMNRKKSDNYEHRGYYSSARRYDDW